MRVFVAGATGLLGTALSPYLMSCGYEVITHAHKKKAHVNFDLTNQIDCMNYLNKICPKVIINLVGLTNVDLCQDNPNLAYLINTHTVENLVKWIITTDENCYLIQISTDQIYDGTGPHYEDKVTLTNLYAFSKYAGELSAIRVPSSVLRTNFFGKSNVNSRESISDWVYKSLVSPLSLSSLVKLIQIAIEKRPIGIFNLGSHDGMSKADFSYMFANILDLPIDNISRVNSNQVTFLKSYRPKDMRMEVSKIEQALGLQLPQLANEILLSSREYYE